MAHKGSYGGKASSKVPASKRGTKAGHMMAMMMTVVPVKKKTTKKKGKK